MKKVIINSLIYSLLSVLMAFVFHFTFKTDLYLSDVGGMSTFISAFATLFGLLAAFVVFEVWGEYNKTTMLIDREAVGLERLFRLTLYFRDNALTKKMKTAVLKYANLVIDGKFKNLGSGQRSSENGKAFRQISEIVRDIKFDDNHDIVVFDQILTHYGELSQARTERINQSLARLPSLLKLFLYISSIIVIVTFVITPFANIYYGLFTAFAITFVISMVISLVEDLDNPFVGHWNISPEAFERTVKHIEEDYS